MKKILIISAVISSIILSNTINNVEKGCYEGKIKKDCGIIEKNNECKMVKNKKYKKEDKILDAYFYKCIKKLKEEKVCIVYKEKKEYQVDCKKIESNNVCGDYIQKLIKNKKYEKKTKVLNAYFYKCEKPEEKLCIFNKDKKEYRISCDKKETACGNYKKTFIKNKIYNRVKKNFNVDFYKCTKPKSKICVVNKNQKNYIINCKKIDENNACGTYSMSFMKVKDYEKKTKILEAHFYKCTKPEIKVCVAKRKIINCSIIDKECPNKELIKEKKYNKKTRILNASFYKCELPILEQCEVKGKQVGCENVKKYCKNKKIIKEKSYFHVKGKELKFYKYECDENIKTTCIDIDTNKEVDCNISKGKYCNLENEEPEINKGINPIFGKFYKDTIECYEPREESMILVGDEYSYNYGSKNVGKKLKIIIENYISSSTISLSSKTLSDFNLIDSKKEADGMFIKYNDLKNINIESKLIEYDLLRVIADIKNNKIYLSFEKNNIQNSNILELSKSLNGLEIEMKNEIKEVTKEDARKIISTVEYNQNSIDEKIKDLNDYFIEYGEDYSDFLDDELEYSKLKNNISNVLKSQIKALESTQYVYKIYSLFNTNKFDEILPILNKIDNLNEESILLDSENQKAVESKSYKDALVKNLSKVYYNNSVTKLMELKALIDEGTNTEESKIEKLSKLEEYNKSLTQSLKLDSINNDALNLKDKNYYNKFKELINN